VSSPISRKAAAAVVGGVSGLIAMPASSHASTGLSGGFASGFVHPLSGFDHLLAMVSVGLWGAFLGRPLIYSLPVIFPLMMVCGAAIGMFGFRVPSIEVGVAVSVLVLGGCIAMSLEAPVWVASLIVATFAVFHGYAHGRELPSAADPIGYSVGFVVATGLLHVLGIGIGLVKELPIGILTMRSIGAAIGCAGVWFLCKALGP
jgi:urease accessory protein